MSGSITPLHRVRDFGNALALGAGSFGLVRHAEAGGTGLKAAGLFTGIAGAATLASADTFDSSVVGSAMQTLGGFALFASRTPHGAAAGASMAISGSLATAFDRYLPADGHRAANTLLKCITLGAGAGAGIGGLTGSVENVGVGAATGAVVGAIGSLAAIDN